MRDANEIKEILEKNKDLLRRKYKIKSIGIFGSVIRGEDNETSDLDLLVDFLEPIGWEVVELKEFIEKLLGSKVDILTYKAIIKKPSLWNSIKEDLIYV